MDLRDWSLPGPNLAILDQHDVARFFGVNVETIRNWIKQGVFPTPQHLGGKPTWTGTDIAAFLHLRGRMSGNSGAGGPNSDED